MGPDQERLALPRLPAAHDVAGRIDLCFETELLEPRKQPLVRGLELRSPGEARHAAVVGADPRQLLQISC